MINKELYYRTLNLLQYFEVCDIKDALGMIEQNLLLKKIEKLDDNKKRYIEDIFQYENNIVKNIYNISHKDYLQNKTKEIQEFNSKCLLENIAFLNLEFEFSKHTLIIENLFDWSNFEKAKEQIKNNNETQKHYTLIRPSCLSNIPFVTISLKGFDQLLFRLYKTQKPFSGLMILENLFLQKEGINKESAKKFLIEKLQEYFIVFQAIQLKN